MSEVRSGWRHALSLPSAYNILQTFVGAYRWRYSVLRRHVLPDLRCNGYVIDIGCGTGEIVKFLPPQIHYRGFDRNEKYIKSAISRFASLNRTFVCEELSEQNAKQQPPADVILALGLLHHLDDADCRQLFALARRLLLPDGFFLTIDPVYLHDQSPLARWVIAQDRGTEVRYPEAYQSLALTSMSRVEIEIDKQPLFIPYSGIIMKCRV